MKKLLTLLVLSFCSFGAQATHLMGGEMTVEHISGNQFVIHLTAYRDTIGIPFLQTANFKVYDIANNLVSNNTVPQDPLSGSLMPGAPYGVEVYFFSDTITVPGPGQYQVEWMNCCRNGAIVNLTNPLGENMFLYTVFTHYGSSPFNSSPEFLAPPVTFVPINQPWQYNSLPLDPDGDSIAWTLDTPYTNAGVYAAGWVTPSAAANGAFTLDPVSGQIDWTPDTYGNFVASIMVEEFRNGMKIGEIRRDYQMIVIDDTTKKSSPKITNMNTAFPKTAGGHYYKRIIAGSHLSVSLLAEDNEGNNVDFMAFGEPLLLPINPATFTTTSVTPSQMEGRFDWIPGQDMVRAKPYIVVFRTRDEIFVFDETVLFFVDPAKQTLPAPGDIGDAMYPNPAVSLVFLPLHLVDPATVSAVVTSASGARVAVFDFGNLDAGDHLQEFDLEVAAGTYMVTVLKDGKADKNMKLVIQ